MTQLIAVSKTTKNALTATDPNDFIFHSAYNTFKIILEGTMQVTLAASTSNQTFSLTHGFPFIPFLTALALQSGVSQVFPPNTGNVTNATARAGLLNTGVAFNYISTDATNMHFNFDNTNGTTKVVTIKYYCLEAI